MTDTLRARIIKAIGAEVYSDGGNSDLSLATRAADAVIRELGLTRRTGQGPFSNQVWYQTDWTIE